MNDTDQTIAVIAETAGDELRPVTWELITLALSLRPEGPAGVTVIVPVARDASCAGHIARTAGVLVIAAENPALEHYNPEPWGQMLHEILTGLQPSLVLAAHSPAGYDFAPALAARMGAGCLTAVESLRVENGTIRATRALAGGKLIMETEPGAGDVVTVLPGSCRPAAFSGALAGEVTVFKSELLPRRIHPVGRALPREETGDLSNAEVIVAAGRGIGKQENLEMLRVLARLFTRSAMGGSRGVCDQGWLEYGRQIGLTGKTVAPKLYIACGISGSPQHIAGMKNSGTVIAVNTDPHAAIFSAADIGVVEDLTTFIPLLIEEHKKYSGNG